MKATIIRTFAIMAACVCMQFSAMDLLATPIFDEFGPLPQATFGGTGIPNDAVAASTQIIDGDTTITVALAASERFSNPAVTNDGAGTYFALAGSNFGGNGESTTEGALWNFNFYINVDGPNEVSDYQFDLFYDFDPAIDNSFASLGVIDVTASTPIGVTLVEDSQNLLFGFLSLPAPPFLTPPAGAFDPDAEGEYTFAIGVSTLGPVAFPLESVAIDVVVQIPEPATATLMILMIGGAFAVRSNRA